MVLETLDIKKNDILIYSENKLDFSNNFRLINKDASAKHPVKIHFNDVCRYIMDETPKSLVAYRLLTNIPNFDTALIKYGFIVSIDGKKEVIHFDPLFAVKELEDYGDIDRYPDLMFRIEQIGLISQLRSFGKTNFNLVYSFDLKASEVRCQNDRVFAEIIFFYDNIDFDKVYDRQTFAEENYFSPGQMERFRVLSETKLHANIVEEKNPRSMEKIRPVDTLYDLPSEKRLRTERSNQKPRIATIAPAPKEQILQVEKPVKQSEEKPNRTTDEKSGRPTFGDFLTKVKKESRTTEFEMPKRQVIEIFKSSSPVKEYVVERSKNKVVLKMKAGG